MILNIYSKRIKLDNENEIFIYDEVPQKIRMQVYYTVEDMNYIKEINSRHRISIWHDIRRIMTNEYGLESLAGYNKWSSDMDCLEFIKETDILGLLDFIEVALFCIREYNKENCGVIDINSGVNDLNHRFLENNLGYEIVDYRIIRVDRKFTHKEIIKPAINLLSEKEFESANEEFLAAHSFYRDAFTKSNPNEYFKNAIVNCNKAFESTMKIICENKRELVESYNEKHSANELINDLILANIIPKHLENSFHATKTMLKGLKASLESGLPVIRNKSGHGIGKSEEAISEEFVTYAFNLAATNIVLLVNIYKKL
ncbi:TPA: STM4504/CBY_0614 family protein [Clostridium perfringens]